MMSVKCKSGVQQIWLKLVKNIQQIEYRHYIICK
jgi:hypothetical protein